MVLVEACVDSVSSAVIAARAGAHRVELCVDLDDGGLTPSVGAIEACLAATSLPVFVMVRPRPGHFCYDRDELDVMRRDILAIRDRGAHGIVFGALSEAGDVDRENLRALVESARPLPVTFHRAFDLAREPLAALETLLEIGVDRLLTSGHAARAIDGVDTIARLVRRAGPELIVMAGGGVRAANVREIVTQTRVSEVHTGAWTLGSPRSVPASPRVQIGRVPGRAADIRVADEAEIARIVAVARSA